MKTICKTVGEAVGCFLVATALGTSAGAQVHVDPQGSFAGEGNSEHPYQLIETAAYVAGQGGALELGPGSYAETLTLSEPMTLSAPNGAATIGRVGDLDVTTFSVYSMNTHLFGDGSDGGVCPLNPPSCLPTAGEVTGARTMALAAYLNGLAGVYDVLCLQEVWDQDQRDILFSVIAGNWPYYFQYGDFVEGNDCLNSGLWILSKYPVTNFTQGNFSAETSPDEGATKGWLECTVTKDDGYSVGLFTTHTQSGHGLLQEATRHSQLIQLRSAIDSYRASHPTNPIFVCGDFNIPETSGACGVSNCAEYFFNMGTILGGVFNDVHPHMAAWYDGTIPSHYTAEHANELYSLFNEGSPSERLDYILYEHSPALGARIVPVSANIDTDGWTWDGFYTNPLIFNPFPPFECIWEDLDPMSDLSDHQAVSAQFLIYH